MSLEGKKISKLLIIKKVGVDKWGSRLWLCKCDCGKEVIKSQHRLCAKNKPTKSCGCDTVYGPKLKNLTGKKFGRWLVLNMATKRDKKNRTFWLCECVCGKRKVVGGHHLREGRSKSCGCYNNQMRHKTLKSGEDGFEKMKHKRLIPGEATLNLLIHSYKRSALNRNLQFLLSKEDFKDLTIKNCYYCGAAPVERSIYGKINGIDRINNLEGYIKSNCVSCCEKCNMMKYTYTKKEFLNQCSLIASHQLGLKEAFR